MSIPANLPYNGWPQSGGTSAPASAGAQRTAFDNLIRRELKVGDPADPAQIARALLDRYQNNPRAQAIGGEARGLPFLNTPSLPAAAAAAPTATRLDLDQARGDVDQDLAELLSSNLAKDIRPELEGWQSAINDLIDDGVNAAQQGLDAYSRDRAFAMRRQLGEYARLARLIGALTPELNEDYRNLAQSLDEVCAVLLVLMGESLANNGFAGGRYLLQVPFSELQARRDAVLVALRNLSGGAQESLNQSTWPRGLDAYRQLYSVLEERGQLELRSLLSEAELARAMDDLVQAAGGGSTSGMRRVGATAWAPLNRFQRFVQITLHAVHPQSPALAGFQEALQLFIDGFNNSGGFRLLRISRPTVLLYGLYGSTQLTAAENRLIELVNRRGQFASTIDCLTRCMCSDNVVKAQIVLDRILFDIDRAIDLYAIGDKDFGDPELRAAACGVLIFAAHYPQSWARPAASTQALDVDALSYLGSFDDNARDAGQSLSVDQQLNDLQALLIPQKAGKHHHSRFSAYWDPGSAEGWHDVAPRYPNVEDAGLTVPLPARARLRHELMLQAQTDENWRPIVEQMASGCVPVGQVFGGMEKTVGGSNAQEGLDVAGLGVLAAFQHGGLWLVDEGMHVDRLNRLGDLRIPRDAETSWDDISRIHAEVTGQNAQLPSPAQGGTGRTDVEVVNGRRRSRPRQSPNGESGA
ncbi:hypothetical protein [Burkholderia stagnalis]|uniref:hypothetical protein n=1 Tax=Burkholderia stagnalis TaxID=1503054 RepID=UPI000F56AD5A|nr:hypothetical protein [Burkholderia stagnalis]RQQ54320.1 hypothetical protein DF145_05370 [Burkholderia stagnalis]RQY03915.1 hypothetical protein DF121_08040 [Burkholderia stagnalis]RQY21668.1 hypothetical protein DF115_06585 [Burkholderia stagnalis]RQY32201.1 hypothetical protein DF114_12185 [Burkholderia stagnalis]